MMSILVSRSRSFYFSLEAFRQDSPMLPDADLIERAFLSLKKEEAVQISLARIAFLDRTNPVFADWCATVIGRIKSSKPTDIDPETPKLGPHFKELNHFLAMLRSQDIEDEVLKGVFESLDVVYRTILSRWVWLANGAIQEDPRYGEWEILTNPHVLIEFVDEDGNNIVERLIEKFYQHSSDSEKVHEIIEMANQKTFRRIDVFYLLVGELLSKESFYKDMALQYYNSEDFDISCVHLIKDPDLKFEVAKLCAKNNGLLTAKEFQDFGIENERELIQIAKLCILLSEQERLQFKGNGFAMESLIKERRIAQYFQNFKISDQRARIRIAELCTRNYVVDIAENIQCFKIFDETARIWIAENCVKNGVFDLPKYIQNFEISDENERVKIALLCAQNEFSNLPEHIRNFEISDENERIRIAMLCIEQDIWHVAFCIQNFKISNEESRIEIMMRCMEHQIIQAKIPLSIKKFAISSEPVRIKAALLCAQNKFSNLPEHIRNFEISDERDRMEIAFLCAQNKFSNLPEHIRNFEISDENERIRIAMLCIEQDIWHVAFCIQNFKISNEESRIEIMMRCMEHQIIKAKIPMTIKNFAVSSESVRIKAALLCAQNKFSNLSESIREFEISDERERVKIALLCAQNKFSNLPACIREFEISDERERVKIAILCAENKFSNLPACIREFEISDERERVKIAILCAENKFSNLPACIREFEISDERERVKIAILCAQNRFSNLPEYIREFEISDERERMEIAITCVQYNIKETGQYIQFFNITHESGRLAIIEAMIRERGGKHVFSNIQNLEIVDQKRLFKIARLCIFDNGAGSLPLIDEKFAMFSLEDRQKLKNACVFDMVAKCELSDLGKEHLNSCIIPYCRERLRTGSHSMLLEAFPYPEGDLSIQISQRNDRDILMGEERDLSLLSESAIEKICAIQCLLDAFGDESLPKHIVDCLCNILTVGPSDCHVNMSGCGMGVDRTIEMRKVYRRLGSYQWKEVIDGEYHRFGKYVFDEGLHGHEVEPGYLKSIEQARDFIEQTLGQPITSEFYLALHKIACGHFNGAGTGTWIGQNKIGVFRQITDNISWRNSEISPEAEAEFVKLDLGTVTRSSAGATVRYKIRSAAEVETLFKAYVRELEEAIEAAQHLFSDLPADIAREKKRDHILLAIARFTQLHDWLHPVADGTGRLEMLLTGKLLVENGFHPVLLQDPYVSGRKELAIWKDTLNQGLIRWRREVAMMSIYEMLEPYYN